MSLKSSRSERVRVSHAPPSISLKQQSVWLGRDRSASLTLPAPTVSRRHASINTDARGRYVLHDHSSNGVFINGQRVNSSALLPTGAMIRIGPFTLWRRDDELLLLDGGKQIRLTARGLVAQTKGKRRLDDISLVVEPGQLVALVGGSGAGKSTLLRTLLGIELLSAGQVHLNGDDLLQNFDTYRTQIGYVPQDDIVHQELTVAEVLTYAARLRLPPDTDLKQTVQQTLEAVEMSCCRNSFVSQLSGGQRKRVNIAVELLADPKLFFLDEPTSGLDPGLDRRVMQLLRRLADQGRTVVLVTHATANIKLCDRIAFLGQGGRLCYFGSPANCLKFFNVDEFANIYNQLETSDAVGCQAERFRSSIDFQHYIATQLSSPTLVRQQTTSKATFRSLAPSWQQLGILLPRYFQIVWRDRLNLVLALFTAPIGLALVAIALGANDPFVWQGKSDPTTAHIALQVLFTFTCSGLWVGLSSSLSEIVKESAIYQRERFYNLNLFAYIASKVGVLSVLALWQTALIVGVVLLEFKPPQPDLISWTWGLAITTFLTLSASFSLGLLVSALVSNVSQANSSLPLLLLPQITFSGVLFKLEGIANQISWLMLSRWSIGAYSSVLNLNEMIPRPAKILGRTIPQAIEVNAAYNSNWNNLLLNWFCLGLHATLYLIATYWIQKKWSMRNNKNFKKM